VLGEDLADLLRDRLVDLEAGLHKDQVRTLPFGLNRSMQHFILEGKDGV
jgi:hypothetical protein